MIQRYLPALLLGFALLLGSPLAGEAKTADPEGTEQSGDNPDQKGGETPEPARTPTGVFENLQNNVSKIDFYSSNYGILFLDVRNSRAGGLYPRGSSNRYLFGGGIWFGAKKFVNVDPDADPEDPNAEKRLRALSVISYNPNSGASWMVPGEISQPYQESNREETAEAINKYRIYFSTDYNSFTGEPLDPLDIQNGGPNWPIWDTDPSEIFLRERYVGRYVSEVDRRNRDTYPKGPAIVSEEDIVTIFKDTDLSRYEIGEARAEREGYPLGVEIDQRIYTWGFGQYGNFIFIRYSIVNKSNDTLYDCFTAPALDTDIGDHRNDRTRTVIPEADQDTLDLGAQWSENTGGDLGYGYMGADFLESPAVDSRGFIRKDKKFYDNDEQLGLHTLRNWVIDIDPRTPQDRYAFMAGDNGTPVRDGDNGAGDKRFLMSTGPFNMIPGDTARIVMAVMIAPAKNPSNPDGTWEDMDSLITLDLFAQKVYDENFLAPKAPDRANVDWRPLDNGVELSWDSTSEMSLDVAERGLDFLGYVVQRGRKAAGQGVNQYDSVVGYNIGFKTIATIPMPPLPSEFVRFVAAGNQNLAFLGPWWRLPMLADFIPGSDTARVVQVPCFDTLKRAGQPDSLVRRPVDCRDTVYSFLFDPYDDENNDSTLFNDLSSFWWNDGTWGDRFANKAIRDIVREAIVEVMDSISNGRNYIDVGDDNQDGQITSSPTELSGNEKLINNIDYYYRVLAYDQGSPDGSTPPKFNTGVAGINEVRATPEAPPAGREVVPEIISTEGLAGISNFQLIVFDNERLGQIFGGDTLEFEFQPFKAWDRSIGRLFFPYWYSTEVIVRSYKLGEVNRFVVLYDNRLADRATTPVRNVDTSFVSRWDSTVSAKTYPIIDSVTRDTTGFFDSVTVDSFYIDNRTATAIYSNTFTTEPGVRIYGTNGITKSTIGVSFDWTAQFFGDSLRFGKFTSDAAQLLPRNRYLVGTPLDPFEVIPSGVAPNTSISYDRMAYGHVDINDNIGLFRSIPSYGNALIEVEFVEGGTERLEWTKNGVTYTIPDARYLIPKVRNVNSFETDAFGAREARTIEYDYEYPADEEFLVKFDTASSTTRTDLTESIRLIENGEFVMLAYDWTETAGMTAEQRRVVFSRASGSKKPSDRPVGTPNRYYVGDYTAQKSDGGTADVRFTHRVIVNGASFFIDFAGMGTIVPQITGVLPEDVPKVIPDVRPTTDFSAGDKIRVNFAGGAIGLPEPGAKVVVAIPDPEVDPSEFTDELLDAVSVVPNPYLVDHLGQRSTGDKQLYFTRLPEVCTIQIYTVAGELVTTIEHSAIDNPSGRVAVNVWDLLTSADRQAESQLLIARITTPSGAETIKRFAIVVGGFRLLTD